MFHTTFYKARTSERSVAGLLGPAEWIYFLYFEIKIKQKLKSVSCRGHSKTWQYMIKLIFRFQIEYHLINSYGRGGGWLCDKTFACYARGPKFDLRSSITSPDWPTIGSSVCYGSLVSVSADRDFKPGSKCCGLQYSPTQQGDYTTRAYISLFDEYTIWTT